jgi:hypothetical protein
MNWVAILKLRTLMTIILPLSNWPFGLFVLVAILKLRTLVTIILSFEIKWKDCQLTILISQVETDIL